MMLTHRKWLQTGLAKVRLYAVPARPCNDNRDSWDNSSGNACHRFIDKVGSSWQICRAFLLGIAKGSTVEEK